MIATLKMKNSVSVIRSGPRLIKRPVFSLNGEVNENYISIPETLKNWRVCNYNKREEEECNCRSLHIEYERQHVGVIFPKLLI